MNFKKMITFGLLANDKEWENQWLEVVVEKYAAAMVEEDPEVLDTVLIYAAKFIGKTNLEGCAEWHTFDLICALCIVADTLAEKSKTTDMIENMLNNEISEFLEIHGKAINWNFMKYTVGLNVCKNFMTKYFSINYWKSIEWGVTDIAKRCPHAWIDINDIQLNMDKKITTLTSGI